MIRLEKILVPTDLSEHARYALPYAVELARMYGAELHLVHVVEPVWGASYALYAEFPGPVADNLDQVKADQAKAVAELAAEIKDVAVQTRVLAGPPLVQIVRYARDHEIDLIVLATHGRTGLSHALIGSVAEKVVQMAPCPTLTVKHPEHEFVLP
ncbi:MAG: universal stress protein [Candidatus Latescibacteria bacterium]|nr:universal stress protein [Candidatus Latescibacterota bacterium]